MDGLNQFHTRDAAMPPVCPLVHPVQSLDRPYRDLSAPNQGVTGGAPWWRLATFLPAALTTLAVVLAFRDWFAVGGLSLFEGAVIALITFTFFWIALSVATATLGIATLLLDNRRKPALRAADDGRPVAPLRVALLVPVYNESPVDVFGNAAAMLRDIRAQAHGHDFALFVLSDTRDDAIARQEERAFRALRARLGEGYRVYYRRRIDNVDRKVGNLSDWVRTWGGAWDAMLVLDADSLMSGHAIVELTDAMSRDPGAGLIQSFPMLFGAQSLFGRVQQFANRIYGFALAEGLAKWTDREGNYWGHNAIIRCSAFASSAGLPKVRSLRGEERLILSHDFVEAGLLRRAGWSVRFLPRIPGSYEEVPATLIDYVLRDRRWCQGNLQHLGLIASRGFHAVSRFHLISGAMGYLVSPAWLALLVIWAMLGNGEDQNVIRYFSDLSPQVNWPEVMTSHNLSILFFMYAMLLAPKLMSAGAIHRAGIPLRDVGGLGQFVTSVVAEILLSIAYAPIMMVQQSIAVARTALGLRETWTPQSRGGKVNYPLATLLKFHWLETVLGTLLLVGMALGIVTLWLLPIALSLAMAVPLSALSGWNMARWPWSARHLGTPEVLNAPRIIRRALLERRHFARVLAAPEVIAAE
ncbi:glucans biosynthesis glucosyltransferase MdoH [Oceaniglobus roseus]|uniref:glucans biosynthesis glucosyltransferase MdoH n=1 Tax=Oceaniglobus roseus TaxID=1737570 RepID=UPI000C7ED861|nr:glucans biosynthesis glucosyltransferase MdoH [Kandeliimicrobium roseum]